MERGSSTHSPRTDDRLADQMAGQLGPGGSNREEFVEAESMGDDTDAAEVTAVAGTEPSALAEDETTGDGGDTTDGGDPARSAGDQDEAEMLRLQHDMDVATDWDPATDAERS